MSSLPPPTLRSAQPPDQPSEQPPAQSSDQPSDQSANLANPQWQQGALVELTITDLSDSGDGVGRYDDRVVFVPDSVTGDRLLVRLVRVKKQFAHGKIHEILEPSPHRIRPSCIVADKCGGCQWQHVDYQYQQQAKHNQVVQALERIGGFSGVVVDPVINLEPPQGYRNKVTFPLGRSQTGYLQAGYYQKGSHQLVNLNQCPIQAPEFNPLLGSLKKQLRAHSIYNESTQRGLLRHLSFRIGRRTGEVLLTLVSSADELLGIKTQAEGWLEEFPELVGVCLNIQPQANNTIFGDRTRLLAGQDYVTEVFAGLIYHIYPTTFFQVHTENAEAMVSVMLEQLNLQGTETIIDAYCGIGTLTLPLAQKAAQVIGLEVQPEAIEQAEVNARLNQITNATFVTGTVATRLPLVELKPDIVVLDPPRKGCEGPVIEALRMMQPQRIVYMSCNPATLARDLKLLCADGLYSLQRVQPADFFPQTAHVESMVFLQKS